MQAVDADEIQQAVKLALAEDIGTGDVTTLATVPEQAVAKGVDVAAYVCWSITTNREWGLPTGPGTDFGLYHVDLDNDPELRRQPTPAAETYRRLIAASPTRAARPTSPGRAARPG